MFNNNSNNYDDGIPTLTDVVIFSPSLNKWISSSLSNKSNKNTTNIKRNFSKEDSSLNKTKVSNNSTKNNDLNANSNNLVRPENRDNTLSKNTNTTKGNPIKNTTSQKTSDLKFSTSIMTVSQNNQTSPTQTEEHNLKLEKLFKTRHIGPAESTVLPGKGAISRRRK